MAVTPDIRAPQGAVISVVRAVTPDIRATQGATLVPYNIPTKNIQSTYAGIITSFRQTSHIEATQGQTLAVVRGRVQTPQIRVFTITLDGHDFYVIRLGDISTLIYDVYSQQWIEWTSGDLPFWRANVGCNWIGAQRLADQYGTDIVVGDDTWGLLYFLDPNQPYDDNPDYLASTQDLSFPRIAMAQTTAEGRQAVPCYVIFLDTDNYGLQAPSIISYVELEFSDDQGQTFVSAGQLQNETGNYAWYSLGQVTSPGRLFRVTDNGLLARIDSMQMNDE